MSTTQDRLGDAEKVFADALEEYRKYVQHPNPDQKTQQAQLQLAALRCEESYNQFTQIYNSVVDAPITPLRWLYLSDEEREQVLDRFDRTQTGPSYAMV